MMTPRDHESEFSVTNAIPPQAITTDTTTNGAVIDTAGYQSLTFVFHLGDWTDGTYTPVIKDSDDSGMSGEAVVTDANLLPDGTGQEAAVAAALVADNATAKLGYRGSKRYVTCDIVSTSTSSGTAGLSVVAIQEGGKRQPIS